MTNYLTYDPELKTDTVIRLCITLKKRYTGGAKTKQSSYNLTLVFYLRTSIYFISYYIISVAHCFNVWMFKKVKQSNYDEVEQPSWLDLFSVIVKCM